MIENGSTIYHNKKNIFVVNSDMAQGKPVASFRIFPFSELLDVSHALRQLFPDHEGDFPALIRTATKRKPLRLPKRVRLP